MRGDQSPRGIDREAVLLVRDFLAVFNRKFSGGPISGAVVGERGGDSVFEESRVGFLHGVWGWGGVSLVTLAGTLWMNSGPLMAEKRRRACRRTYCMEKTSA